jgi:hypothetical protein
LNERGWWAYSLSDVAELGASLSDSLIEAISSADVVVALLEDAPRSANTFYELGLAKGLGKPVMIVASESAEVPSDISSLLLVRSEPDNAEAIALAIEHLSRYKGPDEASERAGAGTDQPIGAYAQVLVEQYSPMLAEAQQLELLRRAIEASGALASVSDREFDIGVWSDDLDAIGANPLLVILRQELDEHSVRQCMASLHRTPGAHAGLIVSSAELPEVPTPGLNWPVLAISLSALLVALGDHSFAEIVRDLRNRSVHGPFPV